MPGPFLTSELIQPAGVMVLQPQWRRRSAVMIVPPFILPPDAESEQSVAIRPSYALRWSGYIAISYREVSTNYKRSVPFKFSLDTLGQNPRLELKTTLISRFVLEDWVLDLGSFAFLVLQQKLFAPLGCEAAYFP